MQSVILIQYTFCQVQLIAPQQSSTCPSCVCAQNKNCTVCTNPWLCNRGANKMAWTKPYIIPANQHIASSRAQKGRVSFYWLLSSNIKYVQYTFHQNHGLCLLIRTTRHLLNRGLAVNQALLNSLVSGSFTQILFSFRYILGT